MKEALGTLTTMRQLGFRPDALTYTAIVGGYANTGDEPLRVQDSSGRHLDTSINIVTMFECVRATMSCVFLHSHFVHLTVFESLG